MSDLTSKKCAFSGHRNVFQLCGDKKEFKSSLTAAVFGLLSRGFSTFLCGMARGFDLVAAETLLTFRNDFDFTLVAVKPCEDQESTLSLPSKELYRKILCGCDEVVALSESYFRGCMQARDRYLVDNCDALLCFLRKSGGGTYYTVNYARKKGVEIIEL